VGSLDGGDFLLLLGHTLGNKSLELDLLLLLAFYTAALERAEVTAALETDGGDKTLNFRSLGVWLGVGLLGDNLATNNVLANIILLAQVEEFPDLGRALGAQSFREDVIGQPGDLRVALLDNDQREDGNVVSNNASTDRLALTLAGTAGTVARVSSGKEELDTVGEEDTLLHWETLLVVTAGDAEDVPLPLVADLVTGDFLAHALLEELAVATLLIDIEELLGAGSGVGDIEFHGVS